MKRVPVILFRYDPALPQLRALEGFPTPVEIILY